MAKILLAEDDKFFTALYKNKLVNAGYEVEVAEDGEVALTLLSRGPITPDIIILDLVMPKKDGYEVLSWVRNNPNFKNIPVIILSSLSQIRDKEKVKELGVNDYFDKSTTKFELLVEKIGELLGETKKN